ncbi:MAG: DinB family protein [Planctomycetes bacterium]|nr:DinB family protein [Planctomycetota bacterium]
MANQPTHALQSSTAPRRPFDLEGARQVLANTPGVLRAWLAGQDERWTHANYGANTFSPFDIVGHLIHGELTDWIPRAKHILERGDTTPFEPFDRFAMHAASEGRTLAELVGEFAQLRAESLRSLDALRLGESDFSRTGLHPALGRVTLGQLLATWVVHDLNHLHQLAKCQASQYRDEVGPWRAYLPLLPPA